jgi:hypothetical protein
VTSHPSQAAQPPGDFPDDFEEAMAGYDRIIHDKVLQQELLDAGLLVRIEANAVAPTFEVEVSNELARARGKFPPIHSLHEGYAVIAEELDEFWDDVRAKDPERLQRAYRELVQVAAMAQRTAEDIISKEGRP